MSDMVNHPSHYKSDDGTEVIDIIEYATKDLDGIQAYDTGNIIKYICRWKWKNGVQDIEKCRWYARHLYNIVHNDIRARSKRMPEGYLDFVYKTVDSFTKNLSDDEGTITRDILFNVLLWPYDDRIPTDLEHCGLTAIINFCNELIQVERKMN